MKVALLSYHNAYNYGGALQAYALQQAVSHMGVDCEYIDYINETRHHTYSMGLRIRSALREQKYAYALKQALGTPFVWSRKRKFDRFYRQCLRKTISTYTSCCEAEVLSDQYDKFIVGSDQVWNSRHNGDDPAYYLSFVRDKSKRISYASSFGSQMVGGDKQTAVRLLQEFDCLSTREEYGVRLIAETADVSAHLVLDPVFLLNSQEWRKLFEPGENQPYTFYYINADFALGDFQRITGWQDEKKHILSTSVKPKDFLTPDQSVTFAMSPPEFLQEIDRARLVVTTSFHCLAFSILFHKPFVAILSGDQGRDERLLNLLKITGLEHRILRESMTVEDIQADIDYQMVDRILEPYISYSTNYLYTAIYRGSNGLPELVESLIPQPKEETGFSICRRIDCVGCGVCALRCQQRAICMKPDREGFLYPQINDLLCTHCQRCRQYCQGNGFSHKPESQQFFAAKNTKEVRAASSSGGVFPAISNVILATGGYVASAEMNEQWDLKHTIASNKEQRDKQAKTYYVQGDASCQFSEIRELLESGETVLFSGLGCQTAALRLYLEKDYPSLFLCDLICHGAPSPKSFGIFIKYLNTKGDLQRLNQRDKTIGWAGYCIAASYPERTFRNTGWLNAYSVMFSRGLLSRPSCYQCRYSNYARTGDITLGDYWGIEKHHKSFKDPLGVSLVIVNTEKGRRLFGQAANQLDILPLKKEETEQCSLKHPTKRPLRRLECLELMDKSYLAAAKKFGEYSFYGWAKNLLRKVYLSLK